MKVNGSIIYKMVVVLKDLLMMLFIKVIIRMVRDTEKVLLNLVINLIIEEILVKEIFMDREYLNGLMEVNLKDNGRKINLFKEL